MEAAAIVSAIVVAVSTSVLVGVTMYYARQTHSTVTEMKEQTKEMRTQRTEAQARDMLRIEYSSQAAFHALVTELRQLRPLLEATGPGSNHIILPTRAWDATFGYPGLIPPELHERLFDIYSGVLQQNATAQLLLNSTVIEGVSVFDSIALTRKAECQRLADTIRIVLHDIETVGSAVGGTH